MAIQLISVKCPDCGATLNIEEGRKEVFCTYCGAKVLINNENEYIHRYIDEAAVKRAETEHIIQMKQMELEDQKRAEEQEKKALAEERREKRKNIAQIVFIAGVVVFVLGLISAPILENGPAISVFGCDFMIGGGILWWLASKNRDESDGGVKPQKIKIPSSIMNYEQKSYVAIEAIFKGAGFSDVVCVPLNDLTVGFLNKPGMVESITVDGHSVTSGGKKFSRDAAVVISYHSFVGK